MEFGFGAARAASPTQAQDQAATPARFFLAFLIAVTIARLVSIFATGFCDDEAYTLVISRAPALSYFDHPPLHQWVLAAFVHVFGEGRIDRLPFLAFNLLTSCALFGLARRLFGVTAAWWTVFLFNAAAYFLVLPDGYIMPDQPLFACLTLAVWAVAEILFGPPGRKAWLWPLAGVAFGLAGLSKYSAVLAPLGLLGFLLFSAKHRRWLFNPWPYLGAALAVVCVSPALIWNAEHNWISFAFQTGRAAREWSLNGTAFSRIVGDIFAQIGSMTPWIFWPLAAGIARARKGGDSSPERLLLWLALPPLLYFLLMPLLGEHAIAHWFNSGWLFAFPLAGAWLAERSPLFAARFARWVGALALLVIAIYVTAVNLPSFHIAGVADPTRNNYDWPANKLREDYARSGARFALISNWRAGGRLGVALGPAAPICAMGPGPQGFAFACDARDHLGEDGFVARVEGQAPEVDASPYFESVAPLEELQVRNYGTHVLKLETGRHLKIAPPLPYGP